MVIELVASVLRDIVGYENSSKEWYWASYFVGKLSIRARLFYPSLQLPKVLATLALLLSWAVLCLLVSCCGQRCVLVVLSCILSFVDVLSWSWLACLVSCLVLMSVGILSCLLSWLAWLSLEWVLASCLVLGLVVIGMGADLVPVYLYQMSSGSTDVSFSHDIGGATIKNSLSFD